MGKKKVLLLAYTGYIIRDLLLGKFADHIIRDFDLIVAVQNPEDDNLRQLIQGKSISPTFFFVAETPKTKYQRFFGLQHWFYRFKQVEKNNMSMEIVTRLWEPNLAGKKKLLVRWISFLGKLVNRWNLMGWVEKLYFARISSWGVTREWQKRLQEIKPACVVSTLLTLPNGMFSPSVDLPVLVAANKLGIPAGSLVQSWDNLSSKTYILPPWLNRYWTWSNAMSEELKALNPRVSMDAIHNVGCPHYDYHLESTIFEARDIFMEKLGLDVKKPYLLIGTGLRSWIPAEPDVVISLANLLKREMPDLQIVLRWHPKDDGTRWEEYLQWLKDLGITIQKTDPKKHMDFGGFVLPQQFFYEQINTLRYASVVINTASSMTVDAAILGRPVISIGYDIVPDAKFTEGRAWFYNNSQHFGALVSTGGVWVVRSEEECLEAIRFYMAKPALHDVGRRKIVEMVTGSADGLAGKRLADEILRLVSQANG